MTAFLKSVAEVFLREYPHDISSFCFVFPNRRSGTFFKKYLKETTDRILLSPEITTIHDFFSSLSNLTEEDPIGLSIRLYHIYERVIKEQQGTPQSYDDFVSFSQTLLSDFNDIDNYLVNADQLFANTKDLHEIDRLDYLNETQRKVLESFFKFYSEDEDKEKQTRFFRIWKLLHPLYCGLKTELTAEGLCYPGMRNRIVAEQDSINVPYEKVIFVGFNAISEAERQLFKKLKYKADFYWDYYSEPVLDEANKANFFVKQNMDEFQSRFTLDGQGHASKPEIELWNVPSAVGQCDMAGRIIHGNMPVNDSRNAVVLADESLLIPMLYKIPENHSAVNITMTYPVKQTAIPLMVEKYLVLHDAEKNNTYYYKHVFDILKHPYIYGNPKLTEKINLLLQDFVKEKKIRIPLERINLDEEIITMIFAPAAKPLEQLSEIIRYLAISEEYRISDMEREMMLDCAAGIMKLSSLLDKWNMKPSIPTLTRSVNSILENKGTAFEGEPLAGLQIMGMLETRSLDFDNIIITSFNEGVFPKSEPAISFIPYNLRKAFNLPTTEHQDAIFAYHFYRLINRAKKVWLIYNSRTDGNNSGEESRYVKQMRYLYDYDIHEHSASYATNSAKYDNQSIKKDEKAIARLSRYIYTGEKDSDKKSLSASAINTYITCGKKFYFRYVMDLCKKDDLDEILEPEDFGNIVHAVLKYIYDSHLNTMLHKNDIAGIIKDDKLLDSYIQKAFADIYDNEEKPSGYDYFIAQIAKQSVKKCLAQDMATAPFTPLCNEQNFNMVLNLPKSKKKVRMVGYIDRIDKLPDGTIRICDYKTGKDKIKVNNGKLFADTEQKAVRQLLFYRKLYTEKHGECNNIELHLYIIRNLSSKPEENGTQKTIVGFDEETLQAFDEGLENVLEEIMDPSIDFEATDNDRDCKYCDFRSLCGL